MRQEPFILHRTDIALVVDGILHASPFILPLEELAESQLVQVDQDYQEVHRIFFAYRIPFVPDFSSSPDFVSRTDRERLAETLDRQVRFVRSLSKWKGMAFSLRYLWHPDRGEVELALLARGIARPNRADYLGKELCRDVFTALSSMDFPSEPVTSEIELNGLIDPISSPVLVEVRQHEEIADMWCHPIYVVYPFSLPSTTWLTALDTLTNQTESCFISVHLQPTFLYPFEKEILAIAAQTAASCSEIDQSEVYLTRRGRISDPVAKVVARVYSDFITRLIDPCLVTLQIGSADAMTARNVAQSLAAEVTESRAFSAAISGEGSIPSEFDLVLPQDQSDLQAAYQTLTTLDLYPWGGIQPARGKERLRHLMDARAATCVFRFPVPVSGGIPGIRTRRLLAGYDPGPRVVQIPHDHISIGTTNNGSEITVPLNDLNRHCLVAGTTGAGKTTTCMHLVDQLWKKGIPFLVIEPANNQYRSLLDSPIGKDLRVFTLGDESVSPFRLNPLEILPGVRVEAHISFLQACLTAALPTFGILPALIERSLQTVYTEQGWSLSDKRSTHERRLMPTLGELYREIIRVVDEMGYSERTKQDIRSAAAGRLGSLLFGSKGRMLNTRNSIAIRSLMSKPTILELESLNDDEKSLVMLFLLAMIREHCRAERLDSKLRHVTIIEEAHRIMGKTAHTINREVAADTRAQSSDMFSGVLSEIRAFGEGLVIAEQIPSRLVEDALKNTNVKIIHRLPGVDDQQSLAGTMNISAGDQGWTLLGRGQAALFHEGLDRPVLVNVPDYRTRHGLAERVSDEQVEILVKNHTREIDVPLVPFDGCKFCLRQCEYRDRLTAAVYDIRSGKRFEHAIASFEARRAEGDDNLAWRTLVGECQDSIRSVGLDRDEHGVYCYFSHLWKYNFSEQTATTVRQIAKGKG